MLLMLFSINMLGFAQTTEELEKRVGQLQSEIQTSQRLLQQTSQNRESTVREIELLQAQIKKRQERVKL